MLWVKAFHIIFVASWFAGLFYLPRLFVNHAMTDSAEVHEVLCRMERKLYRFMSLLAIFAIGLGIYLLVVLWPAYKTQLWLHIKLALIIGLLVYHWSCGRYVKIFAEQKNTRSHTFFRIYNEVAVFFLFAIVILAVVRPI